MTLKYTLCFLYSSEMFAVLLWFSSKLLLATFILPVVQLNATTMSHPSAMPDYPCSETKTESGAEWVFFKVKQLTHGAIFNCLCVRGLRLLFIPNKTVNQTSIKSFINCSPSMDFPPLTHLPSMSKTCLKIHIHILNSEDLWSIAKDITNEGH